MKYMSVENMKRFIRDVGVITILKDVKDYIKQDYLRWEEFQHMPRPASHSPEGCVEVMPACDSKNYSFKYVNNHPANFNFGLQSVIAFGMYADMKTGYPVLINEMTIGTAFRTAAMSTLAAEHLARKNCKTMGMVGTGAQSEFQTLAFKEFLGIEKMRIYDRDPKALEKYIRNMADKGIEVIACKNGAETAMGADILTSCTSDKVMANIISDNMVSEGLHINAIGGDCDGKTELQKDVLYRGDVFVELEQQTREEGEIQQVEEDFPVTELWKVFSGQEIARKSDQQITIFDSVGYAIEDFSFMRYLYEKTADTDYVEDLDILINPKDSRDVFGFASE